jgi:hypothetical protein
MLAEFIRELVPVSYEWSVLIAYMGIPVFVSAVFGSVIYWATKE